MVNKLPAFKWDQKVHYCVHKGLTRLPILSQVNPVHIPTPYFSRGGVPRGFGGKSKRREKELRNKKITIHHRADYFTQNFIFNYFTEKKKVTEREREREREGTLL
jgi:hypothetical protein